MGFNDYQDGLEQAAERQQIIDQYIDEHELLQTADAFRYSFDNNEDALIEIWRIVQTRPATESDIALADIRSALSKLITKAAEKYADGVMRRRSFTAEVM